MWNQFGFCRSNVNFIKQKRLYIIMTVLDYFLRWEKHIPNNTFLKQPSKSGWRDYSWKETGVKARQLVASLKASGHKKGDHISILSANCAEWIICDIALMMGGFISVPLYANVNKNALEKILTDAGVKTLIVGKLADRDWEQQKSVIPDPINVFSMDGYARPKVKAWKDFCTTTSQAEIEKAQMDDVMTIIYTSGTTGDPKGVVHTYGSIITAVNVASDEVKLNRKGNQFISYLPLSHAAERGLIECGGIYCGATIGFVHSLASFSLNIQHIQPTHFFGVPRIWEKFQSKILDRIPQKRLHLLLKVPLVKDIIIRKIKSSLGLLKADVILSGAAPLAPDVMKWFQKLDIPIREAYGMSENFNVISMNPVEDIRIGTVGKIFPGQDIYIDPETKEIRQRCNWLMKEYYRKSDLTNETIIDGYLHTGDMGSLSKDGYLTITGRIKDIFKTAKGEYISPAVLELPFLDMKIVDQACVIGTTYAQPFMLLVLSEAGKGSSKSKIKRSLIKVLEVVNKQAMEYQKLKKVIIASEEWTIENEMLTPTLKIKRNLVSQKYEPILKSIYESEEQVSWES